MFAHSQLAPLPSELPFQIVSKTIGQGAYAWSDSFPLLLYVAPTNSCLSIKKGQIPGRPQVFAVKFIHKAFALRHGHVTKKQLDLEISLHKYLGAHAHIVEFFQSGEDSAWKWIAMELAEGGDLFDKIEADVGVGEELAHCYFAQLVAACAFMHARGVGHRDLKPENLLLSAEGNLKVADFGLATLFAYKGQRKTCASSCGSPPYTAPEVLACAPTGAAAAKAGEDEAQGYYGDRVDLWSLGVILFVLLVGNTPWDEPCARSEEYAAYLATPESAGRVAGDELWERIPTGPLTLLRGLLRVDPETRFTLADLKSHPWFGRPNRHLRSDGRLADGVATATDMFGRMRVDFAQDPLAGARGAASQPPADSSDAMDLDSSAPSATPPGAPATELTFDREPTPTPRYHLDPRIAMSQLEEDPALSQFSQTGPVLPLSCSQLARRFGDVLPAHALTRFVSAHPLSHLLAVLVRALRRLNVPVADPASAEGGSQRTGSGAFIKVRGVDNNGERLMGEVVVSREGEGLSQVVFVKGKGDPLQWRRFFKNLVVLCQEVVIRLP